MGHPKAFPTVGFTRHPCVLIICVVDIIVIIVYLNEQASNRDGMTVSLQVPKECDPPMMMRRPLLGGTVFSKLVVWFPNAVIAMFLEDAPMMVGRVSPQADLRVICSESEDVESAWEGYRSDTKYINTLVCLLKRSSCWQCVAPLRRTHTLFHWRHA